MLKIGIIGLGRMAAKFASQLAYADHAELYAAASRNAQTAAAFAQSYGAARFYGDYQSLLNDKRVDLVYIATPHPFHAEWAIKSAQAGKHVLVEKPLAMNAQEAAEVFEACKKAGVFCMEGFMYKTHPQTAKIIEIIKSGLLGQVRMAHASFAFNREEQADWGKRLFAKELGGGAILDLGCYTASFCRMVAGAALNKPFANPHKIKACGRLLANGVDGYSSAVMEFEQGIVADCQAGITLERPSIAVVYGSKARLRVLNPWAPALDGKQAALFIVRDQKEEQIPIFSDKPLYALEADAAAQYIGAKEAPFMSWQDSLGNMAVLDAWRGELGLQYGAGQ